jgi:F0F1-type ATP synthase assembly protein I
MSRAGTNPGGKDDDFPKGPKEGTGWAVMSYLIGGMVLYGGIGWLIGRWTGFAGAFPIGMLLGLGLALALVVFRFTRSG